VRRSCATCADTRNAVRLTVPLCPTACPTGPELPTAKANQAGVIIRVSGVRVPPPAFQPRRRIGLFLVLQSRSATPAKHATRPPRTVSLRSRWKGVAAPAPQLGRRQQQRQLAVYMGCCPNRRQDRVSHGKCARTGNSPASSASRTVLPSSNAGAMRLAWFGLDRSYRSRAERSAGAAGSSPGPGTTTVSSTGTVGPHARACGERWTGGRDRPPARR
jgi:hypothetical protein